MENYQIIFKNNKIKIKGKNKTLTNIENIKNYY